MNRIFIVIIMCLTLIACLKTDKERSEVFDLVQIEHEVENSIQEHTIDKEVILAGDILFPKLEITRESIFAEFPESPNYFIENNSDVRIERIDERTSQTPKYFGLEPVFVTGNNFTIIYATDNGYEIRRVNLRGKSIFSYWNQYFDATWDDLIRSWGPPSRAESRAYDDSTGWYCVGFSVDKMTGKISEIQIERAI